MAKYPDSTKTSLEQRLRARARERWPQIASLQIRHRGNFSYADAALADGTTLKLCRLRYVGSASQWQFAIYRASHDDYDESVFPTGLPVGTCQDALDTACGLYLNDPTAWIQPPTNLRARPLRLSPELHTPLSRTQRRMSGRGRASALPGVTSSASLTSSDALTHRERPHVAQIVEGDLLPVNVQPAYDGHQGLLTLPRAPRRPHAKSLTQSIVTRLSWGGLPAPADPNGPRSAADTKLMHVIFGLLGSGVCGGTLVS